MKQNCQNVTTQPHPQTTRVKGQSGKATIFSTEKKTLTPYRSRLLPENVEATLCTKSWLYGFEGNLIFFIVIIIQFYFLIDLLSWYIKLY